MISQITPEGLRPASRATSTAASVWPARTSTPPSRATSGKTWPGETICSGPFDGVDRDRDGARAVGGGDAGGDALARLDRGGEGGFEPGAVGPAHRLQAELVDPLLGQREADQAAAVLGHEVDRVGRRHLGGDDEIALILAVLVVDQDEHAAVARLVDDLLGARHHAARCRWRGISRACRACRRSGSSRHRRACAGSWDGGRRRGRGRRGSSRRPRRGRRGGRSGWCSCAAAYHITM